MTDKKFYEYLVGTIEKIEIPHNVLDYYNEYSDEKDVLPVNLAIIRYLNMCLDDFKHNLWFLYENFGLFMIDQAQFKEELYDEGLYICYDLLGAISGNWNTMYDSYSRDHIVEFMKCKGG